MKRSSLNTNSPLAGPEGTGILNNPLYVGRMVWNRRQWRKNPDSEERERTYRQRDQAEWVEIEAPTLRIIDDKLAQAVQHQIALRAISGPEVQPVERRRHKHLLSSLIKCARCGANYVISGNDYYRCASHKERGNCDNHVTVRKGAVEVAALGILKRHLLTDEHAKLFVEEYKREIERLEDEGTQDVSAQRARLIEVEAELSNLGQNMLIGVLSPTLVALLTERESEKAALEETISAAASRPVSSSLNIAPHPTLLAMFHEKIDALETVLDDETLRPEAVNIMRGLIDSITIHPDGARGPEAEIASKLTDLMSFAINDNAAPAGGVSSSISVVAGARIEQCNRSAIIEIEGIRPHR